MSRPHQRAAEKQKQEEIFKKSQVLIEVKGRWHLKDGDPFKDLAKNMLLNHLSPEASYRHMGCGTLLNAKWVLTSAHLFSGDEKIEIKAFGRDHSFDAVFEVEGVRVVSVNSEESQRIRSFEINRVIVHHNFSGGSIVGDIALIQLADELPVKCLNLPNKGEISNEPCKIIGWGATDGDTSLASMKCENSIIVGTPDHIRESDVNSDLFAISNDTHVSVREGDSGGGLMCQSGGEAYISGVLAGKFEDREDQAGPVCYTSVFSNLRWIKEQMEIQWPKRAEEDSLITKSEEVL